MKSKDKHRYRETCVLTFQKSGTTSLASAQSCSGLLLDGSQGTVLTHASLLSELSLEEFCSLDCLADYKSNYSITNDYRCDVLLEDVDGPANRIKGWYYTALLGYNVVSSGAHCHSYSASLLGVVKSEAFRLASEMLLPGWQIRNNEEKEDTDKLRFLLSYFALFKLNNWHCEDFGSLIIKQAEKCRKGDLVEICATPFADLSPAVFMNSHSQGIISNMAGKKQVLMLTDARCIPGSEGGLLYAIDQGSRLAVGIIVASFCWKNNEWIGLSLVCGLSDLVAVIPEYLIPTLTADRKKNIPAVINSYIQELLPLIPLIQVGTEWGSGVLIDGEKGIILTCSHVISTAGKTVRVRLSGEGRWRSASVLFRTPSNEHYDLSLLSLVGGTTLGRENPVTVGFPTEGTSVFALGHALFGEEHHLSPTVTSGTVSKLLSTGQQPVLLQTTCAVHAGASGGVVIDETGHLLGIIVANTKDKSSGTSYPHISISVPLCAVWSIIQTFLRTEDSNVLQKLHTRDKTVKTLWNLGNTTPGTFPVTSKL